MFVLLLESGAPDNLLLESGDNLLLEDGLGVTTGDTRVSQSVLETVTWGQAPVYASQSVLETVIAAQAQGYVSQSVLEAVIAKQAEAWASQVVLEVITPNVVLPAGGFPALLLYG